MESVGERREALQINSWRIRQKGNESANLLAWGPLSTSSSLDISIGVDIRAMLFPFAFETLNGDRANESLSCSTLIAAEVAAFLVRG